MVTQAGIAVAVLLAWMLAQEVSGHVRAVRRGDAERGRRQAAEARRMAAELGFALADAATVHEVGHRVSAEVQQGVLANHVVINVLSTDSARFEQLAGQGGAGRHDGH